jgi:uncharacterized membrane protein YeaQ/YmgE (transglycosylase-associated protein family)
MSLLGWVILFVIAAIAGSLGQSLAGYSLGGCVVSMAVGLVGAMLGRWISTALGLPEPLLISVQGENFPLLWSVIGSALFSAALGLISRRRPLW